MRQTNKQIYDELYRCVQRGVQEQVVKHFPNGLPDELYKVVPAGRVVTYKVTGALIYTGHYQNQKPTKKDIEAINSFRLSFPEYKFEDIVIQYTSVGEKYNSSSGVRANIMYEEFFKTLDHAQAKADEVKAIADDKAAKLATGDYIECKYCRKVVLKSQSVNHNIIGRGRKPVWNSWKNRYEDKACVTQEVHAFCSGQCAGNEQMSREG